MPDTCIAKDPQMMGLLLGYLRKRRGELPPEAIDTALLLAHEWESGVGDLIECLRLYRDEEWRSAMSTKQQRILKQFSERVTQTRQAFHAQDLPSLMRLAQCAYPWHEPPPEPLFHDYLPGLARGTGALHIEPDKKAFEAWFCFCVWLQARYAPEETPTDA